MRPFDSRCGWQHPTPGSAGVISKDLNSRARETEISAKRIEIALDRRVSVGNDDANALSSPISRELIKPIGMEDLGGRVADTLSGYGSYENWKQGGQASPDAAIFHKYPRR
jgi:hypothetical protein